MHERHQNEQYFFDEPTLDALAEFTAQWDAPCCLCTPLLGQRLVERGHPVTILDIDDRFADLPGFQRFDVYRPRWLGTRFDVIVCDPPFFKISLSQLFAAIRLLAQNDFGQPLMISYLQRRAAAVTGSFAKFALQETGYRPSYRTVQSGAKNDIGFFGNVGRERLLPLLATLRRATRSDVAAMQRIRLAVRENRLVSRAIHDDEVVHAIERTGRGWVIEVSNVVVAFAIGNEETGNIWALFVDPRHEGQGHGRRLLDAMVGWLWSRGLEHLWLSTEPNTRADRFYARAGWQRGELQPSCEVRFDLRRPPQRS